MISFFSSCQPIARTSEQKEALILGYFLEHVLVVYRIFLVVHVVCIGDAQQQLARVAHEVRRQPVAKLWKSAERAYDASL